MYKSLETYSIIQIRRHAAFLHGLSAHTGPLNGLNELNGLNGLNGLTGRTLPGALETASNIEAVSIFLLSSFGPLLSTLDPPRRLQRYFPLLERVVAVTAVDPSHVLLSLSRYVISLIFIGFKVQHSHILCRVLVYVCLFLFRTSNLYGSPFSPSLLLYFSTSLRLSSPTNPFPQLRAGD